MYKKYVAGIVAHFDPNHTSTNNNCAIRKLNKRAGKTIYTSQQASRPGNSRILTRRCRAANESRPLLHKSSNPTSKLAGGRCQRNNALKKAQALGSFAHSIYKMEAPTKVTKPIAIKANNAARAAAAGFSTAEAPDAKGNLHYSCSQNGRLLTASSDSMHRIS